MAQLIAEIAREMATNPLEVGIRIWSKLRERPEQRKPRCNYIAHTQWERVLHGAVATSGRRVLGLPVVIHRDDEEHAVVRSGVAEVRQEQR